MMIYGFVVFIDFKVVLVLKRQITSIYGGSRDYGGVVGGLGDHLLAG